MSRARAAAAEIVGALNKNKVVGLSVVTDGEGIVSCGNGENMYTATALIAQLIHSTAIKYEFDVEEFLERIGATVSLAERIMKGGEEK